MTTNGNEPLVQLWAQRNHLLEKSEDADKKSQSPDAVHQFERYALDTKAFAIEVRIANTVADSLAGLLVQARLHGDLLKDGCSWIHTPALTRNVITALERMEGAP